jgi:filamentous hemagglutinin family protein
MASASVFALAAHGARAASPPLFSQGWFSATVGARQSGGGPAARAAAAAAGNQIPPQSVQQVQQSITDLARTAAAISAAQAAQAQARAAAAAAQTTVPDGLGTGGLLPAPGAVAGGTLWQGAALPTQAATGNGRQAVTVRQSAPQALLTWRSFNVGAHTDLAFDQSAGGAAASSWTVLNQINDPTAQPSRVLGSITAPGQVLVVNRNGVIFGAGSQVNVNSIIVGATNVDAARFASSGIYGATPLFTGGSGAVTVEAGASITTNPPATATAAGGFVMLLGGQVSNAGTITTASGQTILASGQDISLSTGYNATFSTTSSGALVPSGSTASTRGIVVSATQNAATGTTGNTGLIQATAGDVTLYGRAVTQAGVILSTTTLAQRGTIHLLTDPTDATATVDLAPNSVTAIQVDTSSTTGILAQRATAIADSAAITTGAIADRIDQSRIEITTGGIAAFRSGALALATGGQIAVSAARRVFAETGAVLDVAGSLDVTLPVSANTFQVNIQGFELRDSPANRDRGTVTSNTVTVDARQLLLVPRSSAYPSDRYYTPGGLLEVSGELGNVGHTIGEYTTPGGTITLASATDVVTQPGSVLNVAGGSVRYTAGLVSTSWLIGTDGRLFNIENAPATVAYSGVFNGFTVNHPRWGVSETYNSPLVGPTQIESAGYSVGRDAGQVNLQAPAAAFESTIDAGVVTGEYQRAAHSATVTDPYLQPQNVVPLAGTLAIGNTTAAGTQVPYQTNVTISDSVPLVAASLDATTKLPTTLANTIGLSATQLTDERLGGLSITTRGTVSIADTLVLADGGQLSVSAPAARIGGTVAAHGGSVTINDQVTLVGPGLCFLAVTCAAPPATGVVPGIALAATATIDTTGLWTNELVDPGVIMSLAYVNGGSVTLDSSRSVTLAAGSTIDASSGGAVTASHTTLGGQGGNIRIVAYDQAAGALPASPVVSFAGTLRSVGASRGGTLALVAPRVLIGDGIAPAGPDQVVLSTALFSSGFSGYDVNGTAAAAIAPGAAVAVMEPTYQFTADSLLAPTGTAPGAALTFMQLPPFVVDPRRATLTQRPGASFALRSEGQLDAFGVPGSGGLLTVGAGSSVTVDSGQSVTLAAYGQVTVDGTITAPAGTISVVNDRREVHSSPAIFFVPGLSVWIGGDAVLDASARPLVATDSVGRPFGTVPSGGTINVGGPGTGFDSNGSPLATNAVVILRPGSVLDASGTSAVIDQRAGVTTVLNSIPSSAPITQSSPGGTIALNSSSNLVLDGTLRAASGGAGAAGGTLSVTLRQPFYGNSNGLVAGGDAVARSTPDLLRVPREISLDAQAQPSALSATLVPGNPNAALPIGTAHLATAQVAAGGFDTLTLTADDAIVLNGNVSLTVGNALNLTTGVIAAGTTGVQQAALAAPNVTLSGYEPPAGVQANVGAPPLFYITNLVPWAPSANPSTGALAIAAAEIDLSPVLSIGIRSSIPTQAGGTTTIDLPGYASVRLSSSGDIRLNGTATPNNATSPYTLRTGGDLFLSAARVYPVTGATGTLGAGLTGGLTLRPGGQIAFASPTGAPQPTAPSVRGSLNLVADVINQGGNVSAPQGTITVAQYNSVYTSQINFLPGSVTSVSLAGAAVPFGGTVDGTTYTDNGTAVPLTGIGSLSQPTISLQAGSIAISPGATLDLRGGGTLAGAAFVSGRGGSTDVLTSPLLTFNGQSRSVAIPSAATDQIYAVVAGNPYQYAPPADSATGTAGATPALGAQIVLGANATGLPPGTYTLLPSVYALQPGGYRVEINTANRALLPAPVALGNGSAIVNGYTAVTNTGFRDNRPVQVTLTSGAVVRTYAQYNEESFSQFALAQASLFGTPRLSINLPEDAKRLALTFASPTLVASPGTGPALTQAGTVLFAPAPGGIGGTASVNTSGQSIVIANAGAASTASATTLAAPDLNALGAETLVIGGTLPQPRSGLTLTVQSSGSTTTLRSGATLAAPQVFLISQNSGVVVEQGAAIDTVGYAAPSFDFTQGYVIDPGFNAVLAVSNGQLQFLPPSAGASIPLSVGACVSASCSGVTRLNSTGTIALSSSGAVSLDPSVRYGASTVTFSVTEANLVGTGPSAASAILPTGLTLTPTILAALLNGDPTAGTPPLRNFNLTATQSTNLIGTLNFDTTGGGGAAPAQFTLSTPALYGFGGPNDVATISVNSLTWSGVSGSRGSAPPGPVIAGGPGSGSGVLDIVARDTITFGYPAFNQATGTNSLDRLVLGFSAVNLNAGQRITANGQGSLSVYQSQGAYVAGSGFARTGGTLALTTPLLTGAPGSVLRVTSGGGLTVAAPAGQTAAPASPAALGAEIDLVAGGAINTSTRIFLPSGRLTMTAQGDIALNAGADLDLSGQPVALFDQTRQTWGGDVLLESDGGNILQAPGARIDVSALGGDAGTITATATASGAGRVAFAGTLLGSAPSGALAGSFTTRAQTLDFGGINASLNAGGFFGARSFDLKTGSVTVGDQLIARAITVSVDAGDLTVTGHVDASGAAPGTIRLSANGNLTIAGTAFLDAHGSVPQTDSAGVRIPAENRGSVELTVGNNGATLNAGTGTLAIQPGAIIDVSAPDTPVPDGQVFGTVTLSAPRIGGARGSDVAIAAPSGIAIRGAASVAVVGTYAYSGAPDATVQANGHTDALVTQAYLDTADADSTAFVNATLANGALSTRLAGLGAYHLRPGVQIVSASASGAPLANADLTVSGDIDLSRYRYSPLATGGGGGEPGVLTLRASGNLNVYGSITDGFAAPPTTPDDNGWNLALITGTSGTADPFGGPIVLPTANMISTTPTNVPRTFAATTLSATIPATGSLNFTAPIDAGVQRTYRLGRLLSTTQGVLSLAAGGQAPTDVVLNAPYTLPAGTLLAADVVSAGGAVLFHAGQVASAATVLPTGTRLRAGTVLPTDAVIAPVMWPAGASLSVLKSSFNMLGITGTVSVGAGTILPANATFILSNTYPGARHVYADASQLPGQSWSLRLVAGADTQAADSRLLLPRGMLAAGTGALTISDLHYQSATSGVLPAASVIRTGTGSLDLLAGGSVAVDTEFGIYTAGAASPGTGAFAAGNYPSGGGDLLVAAQGDIVGDTFFASQRAPRYDPATGAVGNWLYRQGGPGQPASWWVATGGYVQPVTVDQSSVAPDSTLVAFSGFGTLGGGNVTIDAQGNAGDVAGAISSGNYPRGTGLDIAVASTGRVVGGQVQQTGGGDITLHVGGALNGLGASTALGLNGTITDLRGRVSVRAGAIGAVSLGYGANNGDPRTLPLNVAQLASETGGPVVVLGDATASLFTRGDLVLGGAGDATRGAAQNQVPGVSNVWFSLWQPGTSITLVAAGGNLSPETLTQPSNGSNEPNGFANAQITDLPQSFVYPPTLRALAASGSIFYGAPNDPLAVRVELAPSPSGQLELLAQNSINANQFGSVSGATPVAFDQSGADTRVLTTPLTPAYQIGATSNRSPDAAYPVQGQLFFFGADSASGTLHAADADPARVYAVQGDLIDVRVGEVLHPNLLVPSTTTVDPWYLAAKPVQARAGRDIVEFGQSAAAPRVVSAAEGTGFVGSLVLNNRVTDISALEAGRDILESNVQVLGPGTLYVQAGRNLYQADQGIIESLGPVVPSPFNRGSGAGVTVVAGVAAAPPDWTGFAAAYLDPARQLPAGATFQSGQATGLVVQSYADQLVPWLASRYGFSGTQAQALAFFDSLAPEQQSVFLLPIYYQELRLSGREYTDPTSARFKSYLRGREAIATLFPTQDASGRAIAYRGDVTLFSTARSGGGTYDSGIRTDQGGAVSVLTPGGQVLLGETGSVQPGASSGILTQGAGDIGIYSLNSVLLGQSRIFTTFGGSIVIWSAEGDVNAGRGAKTTDVFNPPLLSYDSRGDVFFAPSVPTTGAGIATLAPVAGVTAGDVDLIAPLGAIDAGEAGIRASGNANLAALTVVNAANVSVSGKSTGLPTVAVPNVSALSAATSAAAATSQAAQQAAQGGGQGGARLVPSTISVEVEGFGG